MQTVWIDKLMMLALKHKGWTAIAIGVISVAVAYIDYLIPQEVPVDILYLVPIGIATFAFSLLGALTISTTSLFLFILSNYWFSGQPAMNRQEFWFAILLTGILLYGLGWGSYIFKLNQSRLYRARAVLERQVSDLNTLYRSSQNLVEFGLRDTTKLIEEVVTRIAKTTKAQRVGLELPARPEFAHLVGQFNFSSTLFSISLAPGIEVEGQIFPLEVNGEDFGKLRLIGENNLEKQIYSAANLMITSSAEVFHLEEKQKLQAEVTEVFPIVQTLIGHLTLALQNYYLYQQSLQLAVVGERNRLAREMHDVLAQGFTGIIFQAEAALMDYDKHQVVRQRLAQIEQLARYNLQEARRSVANLRSLPLEGVSLSEALEQQVQTLTRENTLTEASFKISGEARNLTAEVENALYRICQEALNNAVKHAQADKVEVSLDFDEDELCLTISDDGCGFDPGAITKQNQTGRHKFGLNTMRERAKLVGGLLTIESEAKDLSKGNSRSNLFTIMEATVTPPHKSGSRIRVIIPYDKIKILG